MCTAVIGHKKGPPRSKEKTVLQQKTQGARRQASAEERGKWIARFTARKESWFAGKKKECAGEKKGDAGRQDLSSHVSHEKSKHGVHPKERKDAVCGKGALALKRRGRGAASTVSKKGGSRPMAADK